MLGNETDKLALLEFRSQLTEDPFGVSASWNDSFHFCNWKGVTCGRNDQRVTGLDLHGQEVVGTISPHIANLSFLRILDLSENSFNGKIPPEFGRLTSLQNLNLSFNVLGGEIPINLSRCSKLMYLMLGYNNLKHEVPSQLGSLSKLVILHLRNNNLTGRVPTSVGNLSSLQQFSVTYNNLEGEIPDTVTQMRSLAIFGAAVNYFSGMFPSSLYNLSLLSTILSTISLAENNFYGTIKTDIGNNFPNLQKLLLGWNRFTGHIPISLSNATNIEYFDIYRNNFTGNVPINFGKLQSLLWLNVPANILGSGAADDLNFITSLSNCSKLDLLDLSRNRFGGKLTSSITNLSTQLTSLSIYGNNIGGSIPADIGNLINLTELNMELNSLTGTIPASMGRLQNLRALHLGSNHLEGGIHSSIGNLTQLLYLYLHNNSLEGTITLTFASFKYLQELNISHNNLTGPIPKQLVSLSSLSRGLNLSHNFFTGSLPAEVGNLVVLGALDISYNNLSGDIPNTMGLCLALEKLYLQGNSFQGTIPDLSQLTGLQYLDLSSNKLYGRIPRYLVNFTSLHDVNLSFNNLEGEVPLDGVFRNANVIQVHGNKYLCGGVKELSLHPCPTKKSHTGYKIILVIVIVSSGLALMLSLLSMHSMKKFKKEVHSTAPIDQIQPIISYKELLDATDGFSLCKLIGSGNFGMVYEGTIGVDRTTVAIKVLKLQQRGASKSFMTECLALKNIRHRNLVRILTVCSSNDFQGNDFKALVYQFMPNGSLESWLHPEDEQIQQRNLNILQRLNIAIDVASALNYLHHECQTPVVHCDIKPSNVLLDDDMTAHLSDFGVAKVIQKFSKEASLNEFSSLGIKGTIGYAAPEYGMGDEVSTRGDVYSYGILLLEMFTRRRPTEEIFKDNFNLHNFVKLSLPGQVMEIADQSVLHDDAVQDTAQSIKYSGSQQKSENIECLISVLQIGVACSSENPPDRMNMRQVSMELLSIRQQLLRTQMQYLGI